MGKGRSVRLYLAEGTATGILTAEIVNWTGHALASPRTRLEVALERDELKRTGVYLLYGDSLDADLPSVYVGEGDSIASRLRSHAQDADKDYWDRFVAITSKDMNLTKAHVRYLEGRLIALLKSAKKCVIRNKTEPEFDRLPEADISDMENFIEEIQLLLPVIGIDYLRRPNSIVPQDAVSDLIQPRYELVHLAKGISATATETDGEFVVLAGSEGSCNISQSFSEKMRLLREQAFESERIVKLSDQVFRFADDIAFSSPSAAAVFLFGTARNGRTDWILADTQETYAEFKTRGLDGAT